MPGALGPGVPEEYKLPYRYAFGGNPDNPLEYDLTETKALFEIMRGLGVRFVNVTAAARITIRISSGRRCIRRPTAIIRRRIRSSA